MRLIAISFAAFMLAGCASRFVAPINHGPDLVQAVANPGQYVGAPVVWAGMIVAVQNLPRTTQFEVLAYPQAHNGGPDRSRQALGRFLGVQNGYAEALDYPPGRAVTLEGRFIGLSAGRVDDASYSLPKLQIEQIHLWPDRLGAGWLPPTVHIGFGFGYSR